MTAASPGGASRREAEVLALVGARLPNAEIAGRLHLSVRTVENHVSSLLRKYGLADRRALAEAAAQVAAGVAEPGRLAGAPAPLTRFIGRDHERDLLAGALREGRLVTMHGPGGVGKTRLAVEVARAACSSFPSGAMFIDLIPVRGGYVAQAVAARLGVIESPREGLEEAIAARIGQGRFLMVLDNCEHVVDAAAAFAERLLSACPGLRILATSRERLGIRGERTVRLAPLPLGSDAEILFRERASVAGPGFVADPAAVAQICARATGQLRDDPSALAASIKGWERIGARFERACTLLLLPEREGEGHADLNRLGIGTEVAADLACRYRRGRTITGQRPAAANS